MSDEQFQAIMRELRKGNAMVPWSLWIPVMMIMLLVMYIAGKP